MAIVKDAEFTEAIETTDNDQQLQIPGELPVFLGNPIAVGLGGACAAVLVLLFVGWGPLFRLTSSYGQISAQQPAKAQTTWRAARGNGWLLQRVGARSGVARSPRR